tara:strand:+ start:1016 stop:1504 length:489 start_codon:yes stop_codon:yes gene_type:complete
MKKRLEFALEFGGFYHSWHSERIDNDINMFEYDWEKIDFPETHNNYCKGLLESVNNELEMNLEFVELESPKEYNFTTDKIITSIPHKEFADLKQEYINDLEFVEWINEESRSRDGFHSFYSGLDAIIKEDDILLQYMFRYINIENSTVDLDFEYKLELLENE